MIISLRERTSRETLAKKLKFGKLKRKRAAVIRQNFSTDPKPKQKIALEKTIMAAPISIEERSRKPDVLPTDLTGFDLI